MIEMDPIDISPPKEAIRSPKVERPEPDSEPLDILEMERFLEVPNGDGEKDKGVLFSGGDDSLALTHWVMERGYADWVVHLATNTEIPENIDYVREICRKYQYPLIIVSSPQDLETLGCRYGFAGPAAHDVTFNALKGRQLGYLYRRTNGGIKFFSGVRTDESSRRKINISSEVEYAEPSSGNNFTGWWVNPLIDKSDQWIKEYRNKHDLPRNPVAQESSLHRSGDCNCLAYGHRDEELLALEADYPGVAEWLKSVEQRVQEYRGRVQYLHKNYPRTAKAMEYIRKETRPNPFILTLLRDYNPNIYEEVVSLTVETAVALGQTAVQNYIGHGGMSSDEMRSLLASKDTSQKSLCETCAGPADGVSCSVKRRIGEAKSSLENNCEASECRPTKQIELETNVAADQHKIIEDHTDSSTSAHGHEQERINQWNE